MGFINKNERFERTDFNFITPTQIKFGLGKVAALANELQVEDDLSARNSVMIITDKGVLAVGLIDKVKSGLHDSAYEIKVIFDEVPPDSDLIMVERAGAQAKEFNIDLI